MRLYAGRAHNEAALAILLTASLLSFWNAPQVYRRNDGLSVLTNRCRRTKGSATIGESTDAQGAH